MAECSLPNQHWLFAEIFGVDINQGNLWEIKVTKPNWNIYILIIIGVSSDTDLNAMKEFRSIIILYFWAEVSDTVVQQRRKLRFIFNLKDSKIVLGKLWIIGIV